KPIVLVVDDHRFSRTVLSRILNAADYRVEVAKSAQEALERVRHYEPDAFILDTEMPGMDGIELCWRLREQARFRITPILVCTANEDRNLLRSAFTAGCDDFLVKPLEPLLVVARLGGLLKKSDYYKQLERIRADLARYVSPRIRNVIESRSKGQRATSPPQQRDVCVLFSDIRGFTALSQCIEPTELFRAVSQHLGTQVECVYAHHGYVDKFGGDGVMAIFDGAEMACDACRCALDIMDRVSALPPLSDGGPVPIGVGIHAGPVVIGNIGSGDHLDYTAIGETVNVAARLCGHANPMDVIVSHAVHETVGSATELAFGIGETVTIRGLITPVILYHLRRRGVVRQECTAEPNNP
ncbi:MAG: adenylate/guanylate cyclase domain-containing response regulator, partial [Nitrococcus sp.]|nr:adenylate/guanylate cyclase domain-containing response regulator [Nitrococcus sp.]